MQEEMLTLEKFEEASEKVKEVTLETKLIYSDFLSDQTGNKVYLKPENMQFTGAFKVRGAYYKISTLTDEERAKGLITASAGNHAQGVAYAAKCYGCKAVIVMPTTTPLIKVNRTKSYGAEVVLYGDVYDEACAKAYELAEKIQNRMDQEVRITVPGHTQRGGSPCPYDRVLATRLGAAAADLILKEDYGYMVGIKNGNIRKVPLGEVAGKLKMVDPKADIIKEAKIVGISFGDE